MSESKAPEIVSEEAEVVDETMEVSVEQEVAETTPETKPINYLDPNLFNDVRVVTPEDLIESKDSFEVPEEVAIKYLGTFTDISENQVIVGRVIGMHDNDVLIDIGFKSEGIISRSEFSENDPPVIGAQIQVYLEHMEDRSGNTVLSKTKADFMRRWNEIREIFEKQTIIQGTIVRRIKGGMIVDMGTVTAFLPGSQIDVRPIQDFNDYLDKELDFKIVKFNESRKNIVVSHKVILEESLKEQREELFGTIKAGEVLEGRVKNITDFGVFIDLGGVDGLLHITDLSWGRVNHPSEIVKMEETLTVKVIDYDEEKKRISLGLKQLTPHPWENMMDKYPIATVVLGKVVSMTNYGAFIEIEPGVEGLIHVSEMSWTRHIKNPSELYSMGDEVEAVVLSIDADDRKISLGVKQIQPDPWDKIEEKYMVGTVCKGKVMNLTQFGAFIELEEGIDGLIHVSDLSWTRVVRHPKEILEKGQELDVRILEVSRDSRRISLGLKQVQDDPWPELMKTFETGKEVSGSIIRVLDKGIIVELENDVEGIVPFGKRSKRERKSLARQFNPGDTMVGNVMEVKPDEKKVVLFVDDFGDEGEEDSPKDEVKEFLDAQDKPATEKLKIPEALTQASDDEEETPSDEESDDKE
ncbi:MAG: 30S ribosomal protein S1 [Candidatus Marinimicrobia bacterium]|nr:30S ribosomal protein S1 [Candidatus Neomarinimicrobiota bacterium]